MQAKRWNVREDGKLTEAALRLKYLPAWHYRLVVQRYDAGVRFQGTARAGDLYVLQSECRVQWGADACVLEDRVPPGPGETA
jgi:hypothetical protein